MKKGKFKKKVKESLMDASQLLAKAKAIEEKKLKEIAKKSIPKIPSHSNEFLGTLLKITKIENQEERAKIVDWISTGSTILDLAIGAGIPMGKLIEIIGTTNIGKSALGLSIIGNAQAMGGIGVLFDSEASYNPDFAASLGVDIERLLRLPVDTAEEVMEYFKLIFDTAHEMDKELPIIVMDWDTVANTATKVELGIHNTKDIGPQTQTKMARLLSFFFRTGLVRQLEGTRTTFICINQQKAAFMDDNKTYATFGGSGIPFQSAVSLQVSSAGTNPIDEYGNPIGIKCHVKVIKNKVARPYRDANFHLMFDSGINDFPSVINYAIYMKIIERSGAWYNYGDVKIQGEEALTPFFMEHPEEWANLRKDVIERYV